MICDKFHSPSNITGELVELLFRDFPWSAFASQVIIIIAFSFAFP